MNFGTLIGVAVPDMMQFTSKSVELVVFGHTLALVAVCWGVTSSSLIL